ncbi:SH3 domain-containing protein [Oscillospiraceae bacterium 44-5]
MKKVLIFCLSAALLLVSLTACHKPQADQPTEPDPPQTVTTTQADVSTPEPLADPKPEPPEQAPASPDQLSDTIPAAPDEVEDTQPPEETESQEDEVQLFTEVNETVYATGTVNLRSGPSTAHDKVGSLNKSDSVTRVGIGTAEAEGWSRIQLSDGSLVYVSNKYLSTTKPVVQQQTSKPSGGSTTTQQQTGGNQQPQISSGQSQEDKNRADNEAAGQGLAGLNQWGEQHQGTGGGFYEGLPEGAIIDKNGNVGNAGLNVQ